MRPVDEHKLLREFQRYLEKPGYGMRTQFYCAILMIAVGALFLSTSLLSAQDRVANDILMQLVGHLGGFLCGIGGVLWTASRHFTVIGPHISLDSIEKRIEELES